MASMPRRRLWILTLVPLLWAASSTCWARPPEKEQPHMASKGVAIFAGVGMVLLWEAFCTVFSNDQPTILAELLNFLLCRRRHFTQAEKREAVASILYHKMDEFTMIRNPASHFWSCRAVSREFPDDQPENKSDGAGMVIWDLEESSAGPRGFVPRSEGSVIFFANHTLAIEPGTKVAEVVLLRVGNLSDEVGADLATVDGTAFAGSSYKASKQRVVFAPNSSSATFSIELLDCPLCVSHRFFVAHVEAVHGNATMGSSSFTRIRLLPEGVWPPGARPEDVLEDTRSQGKVKSRLARLRLVFAFASQLFRRRGMKFWYVLTSIFWLDFHRVVLNTLLLNYALYDFCLTKTDFIVACQRLPLIVLAKLALVCVDRFASHVKATESGGLSSTCFLQELLIHQYLQSTDDTIELGKFLHMLSETVPESVTYGYRTVYELVHCLVTMVLSILMALLVPMLKGKTPSIEALQPLIWILVPLHWTFVVGFWMRQPAFNYLAIRARDADIEKNGAMIDLLYCRQWLRAYDNAYPVQHVRSAFDEACSYFCQQRSDFLAYKSDTQWVARYFGELTKVFGILFGGYAALQNSHVGEGQMTLGRFTVFVSLYSIIIDVIYMFLDAWDGILYAGILVEELCQFANRHAPCKSSKTSTSSKSKSKRTLHPQKSIIAEHPLVTGRFVLKLSSTDFYFTASAKKTEATLEMPLGLAYGIRTYSDASSLRRRVCEVLGGMRVPSVHNDLGCAKQLLLKPPVGLASGTVLENLLSNAAAWVRASDVIALLAILGIPIPAPKGVKLMHSYDASELLDLLARSSGSSSKNTRRARQFDKHCERFRERCFTSDFCVLSTVEAAEDVLQPAEKHLFDLARGLLADPEVLIVHDMLNVMPLPLAQNALQTMMFWQRLGGLKGMVLAFEGDLVVPEGYPEWLTPAGGLQRTLLVSESTIVCAGLRMASQIDSWLIIQPGGFLEIGGPEEIGDEDPTTVPATLSLERRGDVALPAKEL